MTYPHRIMSSLIYKSPTKRDVHLTMITLLTSLLTVFFFILKVSYLLSCPGDLVQPPLRTVFVSVYSHRRWVGSRGWKLDHWMAEDWVPSLVQYWWEK